MSAMFNEKKALSFTKADQAFVSEATSTGYNNYSIIVCYSIVSVSKLRQTVQVGLNAYEGSTYNAVQHVGA